MPRHETPAQKDTVERVMHEFKHGELKTARGTRKVKNRKQAIAIALHEAGASKNETPKKNARNLRRTEAKEARGETYRDAAEGSGRKSKSKSTSQRKTASTRKAASARKATTSRKATARGRTAGGKTRKELYAEARRRNIAGRSKMKKAQLERALSR